MSLSQFRQGGVSLSMHKNKDMVSLCTSTVTDRSTSLFKISQLWNKVALQQDKPRSCQNSH